MFARGVRAMERLEAFEGDLLVEVSKAGGGTGDIESRVRGTLCRHAEA